MARIGKYEVIDRLGKGGLAEVFLVADRSNNGSSGVYALKRLRGKWRGRTDLAQLFSNEADIGLLLNHPNTVRTYEVGFDNDGTLFIIMEYIGGRSLAEVLQRIGNEQMMAFEVSLHIVSNLLAALHFAHELISNTGMPLNIVHRDVSPDNIFITFDGDVKLSDFGIAHINAFEGSAENRGSYGKPPFMAPEQLLEKDIDRKVDIYAAGVILYTLLTGIHPFIDPKNHDETKLVERVLKGRFRAPSQVVPTIPEELEAIIMRSMAAAEEKRFRSARQMELSLVPFFRNSADWNQVLSVTLQQLFPKEFKTYKKLMRRAGQ